MEMKSIMRLEQGAEQLLEEDPKYVCDGRHMAFHFEHATLDFGDDGRWSVTEPDLAEIKVVFSRWQTASRRAKPETPSTGRTTTYYSPATNRSTHRRECLGTNGCWSFPTGRTIPECSTSIRTPTRGIPRSWRRA